MNNCLVSSVYTRGISYRGRERGILICYPHTDLAVAKALMEAKGIKQLPVVKHGREPQLRRKQRVVAILYYDSIWDCLRFVLVSQSMIESNDLDVFFFFFFFLPVSFIFACSL